MIELIEIPQRSDMTVKYEIDGDLLTVTVNDKGEVFDFTGLEEGIAEEIIAEILPINPIVSAEKIGDIINIAVIRFYGADEKEVFEIGEN